MQKSIYVRVQTNVSQEWSPELYLETLVSKMPKSDRIALKISAMENNDGA